MGLYEQPNDYSCGPFALKHALVAMGRIADERRIARYAHTHWWAGTNEVRLARAARRFDCDMSLVRRLDPDVARRTLVRYLRRRVPVLLCVDDWGHWMTAVRHEKGRFVVLDSRVEPVVKVLEWPELRRRWQYDEDDGRTIFDLHPVVPRFRGGVSGQFSLQRARLLRRPENRDVSEHWDEYLGDLLQMCRTSAAGGKARLAISMGEFLRRHGPLLVEQVAHWYGSSIPEEDLTRVLRNLRFVAETYGLAVPLSAWRRALVDLATLLALWASARGGAANVYGEAKAGPASVARRGARRRRAKRKKTRPAKRRKKPKKRARTRARKRPTKRAPARRTKRRTGASRRRATRRRLPKRRTARRSAPRRRKKPVRRATRRTAPRLAARRARRRTPRRRVGRRPRRNAARRTKTRARATARRRRRS